VALLGLELTVGALVAIVLLVALLVWIALRPPLALSRAIDVVNIWFGRLAAVLVFAAALISAANASVRYLFDYSSNAYLEIQWYLFAAVVLLGAAETLRQNEHVRVDLVYMGGGRAHAPVDRHRRHPPVPAALHAPHGLLSWPGRYGSPAEPARGRPAPAG
jgi:hypothetical protein